jgi:hypothetical protein
MSKSPRDSPITRACSVVDPRSSGTTTSAEVPTIGITKKKTTHTITEVKKETKKDIKKLLALL